MNGVGVSKYTEEKQSQFRAMLRVQLRIIKSIIHRHPGWAYPKMLYVDTNSGSGRYSFDGVNIEGSPLIFLEEVEKRRLDFEAYFLEKDPAICTDLEKNIGVERLKKYEITILRGDNTLTLPEIRPKKNQFGLVYSDPNASCPSFRALHEWFCQVNASRIDWLAYIAMAGLKRNESRKCAASCDFYSGDIFDCFKRIGKKYLSVRVIEPGGGWQWLFVWACNDSILNDKFRGFGFKSRGEARAYLKDISQTQQKKSLIEATRNISDIQFSLPLDDGENLLQKEFASYAGKDPARNRTT